ncbi:hypothetical protein MAPG_04904 [Magnaporthiopsis poae ATCC 64411]|uniref:Uncharacterized protein n=1 Tax=Magnaporthiopsis poae (strain ATCC 64411 / 73-15) TaxID=644358 RepID=A0A0C4DXZ6_MAGP6|nr:hypothetical protein MAPG_04904 [Magnaporthiopsis poae ATCC 64411]
MMGSRQSARSRRKVAVLRVRGGSQHGPGAKTLRWVGSAASTPGRTFDGGYLVSILSYQMLCRIIRADPPNSRYQRHSKASFRVGKCMKIWTFEGHTKAAAAGRTTLRWRGGIKTFPMWQVERHGFRVLLRARHSGIAQSVPRLQTLYAGRLARDGRQLGIRMQCYCGIFCSGLPCPASPQIFCPRSRSMEYRPRCFWTAKTGGLAAVPQIPARAGTWDVKKVGGVKGWTLLSALGIDYRTRSRKYRNAAFQ